MNQMLAQTLQANEQAATQRVVRMSYDEYLALPDDAGIVEWVRGEAIFHMPPVTIHQIISAYLSALLTFYVEFLKLGQVLEAAFEMKCGDISREPDILFIFNANLSRLTDKRLEGPADLAIEIVSNDSVERDYYDKLVEYQACGVREYWIIDPRPGRRIALFHQLDSSGKYQRVDPQDGIYRCRAVPNFWLKVDWIRERPDPMLTFAQIAGFSEQMLAELNRLKRAD
jgi:Uma2 family endonuclease